MPEMVAPRALVFRPLVKGNEDSGDKNATMSDIKMWKYFQTVVYMYLKKNYITYKVGYIHNAIFNWMRTVHSEFQLRLLLLLLLFL